MFNDILRWMTAHRLVNFFVYWFFLICVCELFNSYLTKPFAPFGGLLAILGIVLYSIRLNRGDFDNQEE